MIIRVAFEGCLGMGPLGSFRLFKAGCICVGGILFRGLMSFLA